MQCHKCPYIESLSRGDYVSKPWKETPCAKCKLGEDTFYSVSFDEEVPPESTAGNCGCSEQFQPALSSYSSRSANFKPQTPDAMLPSATIAQFIQGILSLDPILRDIVAWRYQGVPYKEIAKRQGTSTQLAEMRHKRALRDWPALEFLFPEKVAKRQRRKSSLHHS